MNEDKWPVGCIAVYQISDESEKILKSLNRQNLIETTSKGSWGILEVPDARGFALFCLTKMREQVIVIPNSDKRLQSNSPIEDHLPTVLQKCIESMKNPPPFLCVIEGSQLGLAIRQLGMYGGLNSIEIFPSEFRIEIAGDLLSKTAVSITPINPPVADIQSTTFQDPSADVTIGSYADIEASGGTIISEENLDVETPSAFAALSSSQNKVVQPSPQEMKVSLQSDMPSSEIQEWTIEDPETFFFQLLCLDANKFEEEFCSMGLFNSGLCNTELNPNQWQRKTVAFLFLENPLHHMETMCDFNMSNKSISRDYYDLPKFAVSKTKKAIRNYVNLITDFDTEETAIKPRVSVQYKSHCFLAEVQFAFTLSASAMKTIRKWVKQTKEDNNKVVEGGFKFLIVDNLRVFLYLTMHNSDFLLISLPVVQNRHSQAMKAIAKKRKPRPPQVPPSPKRQKT